MMAKTKEIFLIDSAALITPYNSYYSFDLTPRFWQKILEKIENQEIVILDLVREEVSKGQDRLRDWILNINRELILDRRNELVLSNYVKILEYLQTSELYKEKALTEWSQNHIADPWLIAAALSFDFTVITLETRNNGLQGPNKVSKAKIPDVCDAFNVPCRDLFYMMRALSFTL